jgi:phosphoribosylaminoimidazolecarboxamide formyltransferase/IMP cyclohydrolase
MRLAQGLRYGENPHQAAAFYVDDSLTEFGRGGVATSVQHHGKEMSYNNYLDADAAYSCTCDFKVRLGRLQLPAATVNPCGLTDCRWCSWLVGHTPSSCLLFDKH